MNATFHVLTAAGIAHLAARNMALAEGARGRWADVWVVAPAFLLSALSHGVLDGLKHGYPLPSLWDVVIAGTAAILWGAFLQRRYIVLALAVIAGSLAPDLIDLGLPHVQSFLGLPSTEHQNIFPWHRADGSGSMYLSTTEAPARMRILDQGDNQLVSWTNHFLFVVIALTGILSNRSIYRKFDRTRIHPS